MSGCGLIRILKNVEAGDEVCRVVVRFVFLTMSMPVMRCVGLWFDFILNNVETGDEVCRVVV